MQIRISKTGKRYKNPGIFAFFETIFRRGEADCRSRRRRNSRYPGGDAGPFRGNTGSGSRLHRKVATPPGFEPGLTGPKPVVLPLHHEVAEGSGRLPKQTVAKNNSDHGKFPFRNLFFLLIFTGFRRLTPAPPGSHANIPRPGPAAAPPGSAASAPQNSPPPGGGDSPARRAVHPTARSAAAGCPLRNSD